MRRLHAFLGGAAVVTACVVPDVEIVSSLGGAAGDTSSGGSQVAGSGNGGANGLGGDSSEAGESTGGGGTRAGSAGSSSGSGNGGNGGSAGAAGSSTNAGSNGVAGNGGTNGVYTGCADLPEAGLLLCDDFESGLLDNGKWMPPPGIQPTSGHAHSGSYAVSVPSVRLRSTLTQIPLPATISFWMFLETSLDGMLTASIASFDDSLGNPNGSSDYIGLAYEPPGGFNWIHAQQPMVSSGAEPIIVPAAALYNQWLCVTIRVQSAGVYSASISNGTSQLSGAEVDDSTSWVSVLPAEHRVFAGYPGLGPMNGSTNWFDDFVVYSSNLSICDFEP